MTADIATLHENVDALISEIRREGDVQAEAWKGEIDRAGFADSALNLAHYLALRRRDLRPLQRPLTALGLSSVGLAVRLKVGSEREAGVKWGGAPS